MYLLQGIIRVKEAEVFIVEVIYEVIDVDDAADPATIWKITNTFLVACTQNVVITAACHRS